MSEVKKFVEKFQRNFLAYPYLLQAAFGLGDEMFEEYEKLSNDEKLAVCEVALEHCKYFITRRKRNEK